MKKNKRNGIKHILALMLFCMVLSIGIVCLADVQGTVIAKSAVIAIDIDKMQAKEDLKRDMQVLLAKSSCKQISREEVHALIDEIYEGYEE